MGKIVVRFACDAIGDHTAEASECLQERKKEFKSLSEAEPFIQECTEVLNLGELYGVVPLEEMKSSEIDKTLFI